MRALMIVVLTSAVLLARAAAGEECLIRINLEQKQLVLSGEKCDVKTFPIAVPRHDLGQLPWEGVVTAVEKNPSWYPTELTRKAYLKKKKIGLPKHVSHGDPRNAMGRGKITIRFLNTAVKNPIRIHGTNDESSIGKKVTRGCFRMKNEDIVRLIDSIRGKRVRIFIS